MKQRIFTRQTHVAVVIRIAVAPRHQNHVHTDVISGQKRHAVQIQRQRHTPVPLHQHQRPRVGLSTNDNIPVLDQYRYIGVDIVPIQHGRVGVGQLEVVKVGRLVAQPIDNRRQPFAGIDDLRLVVCIQVSEFGIHLRAIGSHGVNFKVATEIGECQLLSHAVIQLIVGTVFVILRHFHVPDIRFYLPVSGDETHGQIKIGRSGRIDTVADALGADRSAILAGVVQEGMGAVVLMLRLISIIACYFGHITVRVQHAEAGISPVWLGHGAVIRQAVSGVVIEGNTVCFGYAGRHMVVGTVKADGGNLLETIQSPTLVQVQDGQPFGLASLCYHWEDGISVGIGVIVGVVQFLAVTRKVLADLHRYRQHPVAPVKYGSAFQTAVGRSGKNVNLPVAVNAVYLKGHAEHLARILVQSCKTAATVTHGKLIGTTQCVIPDIVRIFLGIQHANLGQRIALTERRIQEGVKVMSRVGIDAVSHVAGGTGFQSPAGRRIGLANDVHPVRQLYGQAPTCLVR